LNFRPNFPARGAHPPPDVAKRAPRFAAARDLAENLECAGSTALWNWATLRGWRSAAKPRFGQSAAIHHS
jgi:hypothetical protein